MGKLGRCSAETVMCTCIHDVSRLGSDWMDLTRDVTRTDSFDLQAWGFTLQARVSQCKYFKAKTDAQHASTIGKALIHTSFPTSQDHTKQACSRFEAMLCYINRMLQLGAALPVAVHWVLAHTYNMLA